MNIEIPNASQRLNVSVRGSTVAVWCAITKDRWQARIAANPQAKADSLLQWLDGRVESPAEFFAMRFPEWAAKVSL